MRIKTLFSALVLVAAAALVSPITASGSVILAHFQGNTSPRTQRWSQAGTFVTTTGNTGPVSDNNVNAWRVVSNSVGYYYKFLSDPTAQMSKGWKLTAKVRLTTTDNTINAGEQVQFTFNNRAYYTLFGTDSVGTPQVAVYTTSTLQTSLPATIAGGENLYNIYELVDNDGNGSASLYVNGVQILSNYNGISGGSSTIIFGDISSSGPLSNADYAQVTLEAGACLQPMAVPVPPSTDTVVVPPIIPEPASLALLVTGALLLLPRQRRD